MSDKRFFEHNGLNLSDVNREVLKQWEREGLFERSLKERADAPPFVFYEGPPSANGMPGIHHVIARAIKDVFCRYKTMQGYLVQRKAGWDTHGLPVELGVEKNLGITKADIGTKVTVAEYNEACRKEVMKYTAEWEELTKKMGYWVDMNDPYITYDNRYIETLWYLLKQLYQKNLLYKGYTIQPYSPAAGTGLSSHELNQPGTYRDVTDTTVTAMFEVISELKDGFKPKGKLYLLAWTTTPWTLPSNTALAVGANISYVVVETFNPYSLEPVTVLLAESLLGAYLHADGAAMEMVAPEKAGAKVLPYRIVHHCKGSDLVDLTYRQLFPWVNPGEGAFRVISGDFVTTEDGTGIVHIAPTFGADDNRVAKQAGVPALTLLDREGHERPMVDLTGKYFLLDELSPDFVANSMDKEAYSTFEGRFVKNAYDDTLTEKDETLDLRLALELKERGVAFKVERQVHNYPHCWRTDKPILYYPLDSWFIRTTASQERMKELNETIQWKPASTGAGRFGKWLENLQDWNLSRSRYWGTPLPIWRNESGSEEKCIGSVEELYTEIEAAVQAGVMTSNPFADFRVGDFSDENYAKIDLHRPYVDDIILVSQQGEPMYRESDLIDVWFDSGAMPYAQLHYPFQNKELIDEKKYYPADFIAEGVDQTRGWFYTLHALGTMLFDSVAFKNVVSNGLVLDKDGNKMSKRLGNSVDPFEVIETKGSDPLRWYMLTNAAPWDNLRFDLDGVDEVQRKFFGTLYNTYSFFALYANLDNFSPDTAQVPLEERAELDRWILSELSSLVQVVTDAMEQYEPTKAGRAISEFVNDQLSNWYVRLSRKRFWGGGMSIDKLAAYQTLYECLETVARLMAPFAPFYADQLYRDLVGADASVHLARFPIAQKERVAPDLEQAMRYAQKISSMILALRRRTDLKVRQPLQKFLVLTSDEHAKQLIADVEELILSEVNVKELIFSDGSDGVVVKRVKPNFRALGPIFGKEMKLAAETLSSMGQEDIAQFEKRGVTTCLNKEVSLEQVEIISEDIPGWLVQNDGSITVALDTNVTDELRCEGLARELVNRIQNLRKEQGFSVSDKIKIELEECSEIAAVLQEHQEYIQVQVQALSIELKEKLSDSILIELADGLSINVVITIIK